jgi:outer membrane lipoprotein carrier protein
LSAPCSWWRRSAAVLALGLGLSLPARALSPEGDPETAAELVTAVESTWKGVSSLKADFVQVQRSATAGETRQKGRVQLERPRKARWEFQGEQGSVFVTNGKTMWIYSPSTRQVIEQPDTGTGGGTGMVELLSGLEKLDELFDVKLVDSAGGASKRDYVVELKPRGQAQFQKLTIQLSRKKYDVEKVVVHDLFGNQTELTFSQMKLNVDVPDAEFDFKAPAGVQVIKGGI